MRKELLNFGETGNYTEIPPVVRIISETLDKAITMQKMGFKYNFFYFEGNEVAGGSKERKIVELASGIARTTFTATMDIWCRMRHPRFSRDQEKVFEGLPGVQGRIARDGTRSIMLWPNSISGTDFQDAVLSSGITSIEIRETGQIIAKVDGTKRELTETDTVELSAIFLDAQKKLDEVSFERRPDLYTKQIEDN